MLSLDDLQTLVRRAVIDSEVADVAPRLVGGMDPRHRLAIHRRHYHASLIETLRGRFPATAWLIGDAAVTTAAAAFVIAHPPRVFCMAEFGETFPEYLASRPGLDSVPYLASFAQLEWLIGRVSVSVSAPALGLEWVSQQDPERLGSATLRLQPGVVYLRSDWTIDALMRVFLSGAPPAQFTIEPTPRWIEVHGNRGDLRLQSLAVGAWHFRRALDEGLTVEGAAEAAIGVDAGFDPGAALVHLIAEGLAYRVTVCPP